MLESFVLCMALNVYHEGDKRDGQMVEPLDGLFAIAQTTLNRAQRDPDKVCAVVQAKSQFSWTLKPPPVEQNPAWDTAQRVARLSYYMADFTGGAVYYHALYVSPYWKANLEVLGQWGNHIFYRHKVKR